MVFISKDCKDYLTNSFLICHVDLRIGNANFARVTSYQKLDMLTISNHITYKLKKLKVFRLDGNTFVACAS